ncbi:MAG: LacI family DNA-binding transcriptional regulator [Tetrasphaera sp.]
MTARPRAADVARAAGVSVTAVSFVLNGNDSGNISAATKERVLRAAAELGYRPNRLAQSLRRQRSHVVGLLTDSIASSPFAGRLLAGAADRAGSDGYVLLVHDSHGDARRDQGAVDEMLARQVDGLVYATMGLRELESLPLTPLPLVLANCYQSPDAHPSVVPDDAGGARIAAETLLLAGHRRITMLGGTPPRASETGFQAGNVSGPVRERAFRTATRAAGLRSPDVHVRTVGWQIDDGYRGALRVLADGPGHALPAHSRPSGIVAVNDRVAAGAMLAAASLGIRVPDDLSIVGFDDQEGLAAFLVPGLTTLALPHEAMGHRAVDLLFARLGGEDLPATRELLPCPLVERGTVAPPLA